MSDTSYTTFIDAAGRTIFGSKVAESDSTITVENPVVIMVQQQQNGQMAVQLFPLFFPEFIVPDSNDKRDTTFTFSKVSLAVGGDFQIEPRIIEQYEKVVHPVLEDVPPAQPQGEPETIKLFDEE